MGSRRRCRFSWRRRRCLCRRGMGIGNGPYARAWVARCGSRYSLALGHRPSISADSSTLLLRTQLAPRVSLVLPRTRAVTCVVPIAAKSAQVTDITGSLVVRTRPSAWAVLPAVVIMYRAGTLPITMDETGSFCPDTEVIAAGHSLFSQVGRDGSAWRADAAGGRGWWTWLVDVAPRPRRLGTRPRGIGVRLRRPRHRARTDGVRGHHGRISRGFPGKTVTACGYTVHAPCAAARPGRAARQPEPGRRVG